MVKWSYQALEVTQAVCACVCGAVQASPLAVHQVVHLVPRQACAQQSVTACWTLRYLAPINDCAGAPEREGKQGSGLRGVASFESYLACAACLSFRLDRDSDFMRHRAQQCHMQLLFSTLPNMVMAFSTGMQLCHTLVARHGYPLHEPCHERRALSTTDTLAPDLLSPASIQVQAEIRQPSQRCRPSH